MSLSHAASFLNLTSSQFRPAVTWSLAIICGFSFATAQEIDRTQNERPVFKNSLGMEFVLIPAGQCNVGSPPTEEHRAADEELLPIKFSNDFYLGRYEVMQFEYEEVMASNPSFRKQKAWPVNDVTWAEAESFCAKLSALDPEKKAGRSYRLPTEGEWEYACRAGTTTAYYFGDSSEDLDKHAWTINNSEGKPQVPGGKLPNPWGLYDMYGNVQELCTSVRKGSQTAKIPQYFQVPGGSKEASSNDEPVARGGAYWGNKIFSKGAYRSAKRTKLPLGRRPETGFRIVMEQSKEMTSK